MQDQRSDRPARRAASDGRRVRLEAAASRVEPDVFAELAAGSRARQDRLVPSITGGWTRGVAGTGQAHAVFALCHPDAVSPTNRLPEGRLADFARPTGGSPARRMAPPRPMRRKRA